MIIMRRILGGMSRPLRVVMAVLLLTAALMSLAIALSQTILHYMLPGQGDTVTRHTAVFMPAVIASVVAGVTVLVTAAWIYFVARLPRHRGLWFAVLALLAVDVVVLVIVSGMVQPDF